jgi:hypothetical protein
MMLDLAQVIRNLRANKVRLSVAILLFSFYCRVSHAEEWYIIPQYHLNKRWSIIAEFDNLYGSPSGVSTNQHVYIAGLLYGRNVGKRLYPFVFGEVGDIRISAAGEITHSFIFCRRSGPKHRPD